MAENSAQRSGMMVGTLLMLTGVILGAFGAHGLEDIVDANQLKSYETGVRYQIYHGLGLLIISQTKYMSKSILLLMTIGVILFSLSIYGLVCQGFLGVNLSFLGPITPIGGALLILAWVVLFINILREKSTN